MRSPGVLALLIGLTIGAGVIAAAPAQRLPRVQPLIGVGPDVPSAPAVDPAAPFFDDTVLQELRLVINSKDWATLKENYLSNEYYPCDVRWNGQTVRNVGIRSRGTGSRSGVKPGLRVDFDRYTTAQQFLGLKSFVLRNNTQDETNLHERLAMQVYRRVGAAAPRETHARVYVNDEYVGIFTVVEAVDKAFLRRVVGEDAGYLFEYDYPRDAAPYYFEDRGSEPSAYVPLPFKPETHEDDPRPEYIVRWVEAVNRSSEATFLQEVSAFVDLDQLVRHVAVEVFLGDYDGFVGNWGVNNLYAYRADGQSTFVLFPWDKSEAFKADPASSILHNMVDVPEAQRNRLFSRLLSYREWYDRYLDTLIVLAQAAAEPAPDDPRGWLERELEREYLQIREATLADPQKPFSNEAFEAAIATLRDFVRRRPSEVAEQVGALRR